MVSHSLFLRFKSSQVAASALLLAINIHQSPIAEEIGLPCQLENIEARSFFFEATSEKRESSESEECPLRYWNAGVRRLTSKCVGKDIKPCYKVMINLVNKMEFEELLSKDASLFPSACKPGN